MFVVCTALLLAGAATITTSGGCSDYEDDGYDRDRSGDSFDGGREYYDDGRRYDDRDDYDRRYREDDRRYHGDHGHGRDWDDDRDRDRDWDREDDNDPIRIPRDADLVANGDRSLGYTATTSGRLYVRDERTRKVIYAGRVRAGQKLTIDPGRGGIAVDGRKVKKELDNKPREREVFFRPDRGAQSKQPRLTPIKGGKSKSSSDQVVP